MRNQKLITTKLSLLLTLSIITGLFIIASYDGSGYTDFQLTAFQYYLVKTLGLLLMLFYFLIIFIDEMIKVLSIIRMSLLVSIFFIIFSILVVLIHSG